MRSILSRILPVLALAAAPPAHAQFKKASDPGQIVAPRTKLGTRDEVNAMAFSPDGSRLATSADRKLIVWEVASGSKLYAIGPAEGHAQPITCLAYSPDGKTIATGAKDEQVKLWDATSGKAIAGTARLDATVRSVAFAPDGKTLAVGAGEKLKLFDAVTLRFQAELTVPNDSIRALAYSGDGSTLASGDSAHGDVTLWQAATGIRRSGFRIEHGLAFMAYSRDGKLVATAATVGENPKKVEIRESATGRVKVTVPVEDEVWGLAFSPDGGKLAIASLDKTAKLVDVASGKILATFEGHTDSLISVAFSADGKTLATGAHSTAFLWDVP